MTDRPSDRPDRLTVMRPAIQDIYPSDVAHCYGCGRLNQHGLQIKTHWDGVVGVATFQPEPHQIAMPGFVYGGLIASLIDCHGVGTAAAAAYQREGREPGTDPPFRYVTAALHVDFLRPTPLGPPLELRATVKEMTARKVITSVTLSAGGELCARGEVVAVQMPEEMQRR